MPRKKQTPEETIAALRKELADYKTMYETASRDLSECGRRRREAEERATAAEQEASDAEFAVRSKDREIAHLQRDLERAYGFIEGRMGANWPGAMRGTLHGATEDFSATVEQMKQDRDGVQTQPVTQTFDVGRWKGRDHNSR